MFREQNLLLNILLRENLRLQQNFEKVRENHCIPWNKHVSTLIYQQVESLNLLHFLSVREMTVKIHIILKSTTNGISYKNPQQFSIMKKKVVLLNRCECVNILSKQRENHSSYALQSKTMWSHIIKIRLCVNKI